MEPGSAPTEPAFASAGIPIQTLRHELRTPVNHIIGYSEILLEEAADQAAPERFGPLREAIAAARAILSLIGASLADPGPEAVALDQLHGHIAPHTSAIRRICAELEGRLTPDDPASYRNDLARISVAAEQLDEIAGEASRGAERPGATAAPEGWASDEPPPATGSSAPLLLVDDNPLNRDVLGRRLARLGYQVELAADGIQALERLRRGGIDLVLLDLMMPDLDGYGVLEAMKGEEELRHIPVIVLSALDDTESIVRAVEMGADDYLPKPFDPVLLKARISACLFKKQMHDDEVDQRRQIEEQKRRADDLLHVVIPLGVALSVEKDFNQLLERIVVEAQELCNADGGTLYLRTDDQRLRFVIVRSRSLNIAMGGASGKDIPFAPLRLYDEATGQPQYNYVVAHAALDGRTINIADAYDAAGYDFSGTRDFDQRTGYRSTSILNIPLKDGLGRVIGVLQLINAQDDQGHVIAFDDTAVQMLESLGALAAAALAAYAREQQLRAEIADLRIEIDQVKQQREVERITGSGYFSQLQEQARQLRQGGGGALAERRRRGAAPEKRVLRVGDQEIHVHEAGPERGRLLLLIHGWSSSWYALSPLLPVLSDRYRCVAVDLPGYGESPPLSGRASIPAYADLLAELIGQLSPGLPAVLVGHSMGGMISLTMALRHPALIERMVLLCPTITGRLSFWINTFVSPITMIERVPIFNQALASLEPYMLSVTDRLMRPASFAERSTIDEADYHRLRADARRPGQGRVRAECFAAMRQNDLTGKLGVLNLPSLVIWGMEDNTVPLRDASLVADEWESAELRVLPKAGHWPQFETPDVTRRHVRSFLSTPIKLLKAQF